MKIIPTYPLKKQNSKAHNRTLLYILSFILNPTLQLILYYRTKRCPRGGTGTHSERMSLREPAVLNSVPLPDTKNSRFQREIFCTPTRIRTSDYFQTKLSVGLEPEFAEFFVKRTNLNPQIF